MGDRNVLGGELQACSMDPVTGWFRDGSCVAFPSDIGKHTLCAVVTREFLEHQAGIGNDLVTPMPEYQFPGLQPGDRWCVTVHNWIRAHTDGVAAPIVLAATNEACLEDIPLSLLQQYAVDVPDSPGDLG
jgi:uncharacterized protein (DUF2237 family)